MDSSTEIYCDKCKSYLGNIFGYLFEEGYFFSQSCDLYGSTGFDAINNKFYCRICIKDYEV